MEVLMNDTNYKEMLAYVENVISNAPVISDTEARYPFRNRFKHILRVLKWCERLLEKESVESPEIVYIAAIFHDSGKPYEGDRAHADISAEICRNFLENKGYEEEKIQKICYCIKNHSRKLLEDNLKEEPKELIVLMEADVMDEIGAMGALWDTFATALEIKPDYDKAFERIESQFQKMKVKGNRAYTPTGKAFYAERIAVLERYIEELRFELEPSSFWRE